MPRGKVTQEDRKRIRKRVEREFPGCSFMRELHYSRYTKEIEWRTMSPEEIVQDIRQDARKLGGELKTSAPKSDAP